MMMMVIQNNKITASRQQQLNKARVKGKGKGNVDLYGA